jgi:hypothetical protein
MLLMDQVRQPPHRRISSFFRLLDSHNFRKDLSTHDLIAAGLGNHWFQVALDDSLFKREGKLRF